MASTRVDQRARDLHSPMVSALPEVGSPSAVQWQPVAADGGQMLPYFCPAQRSRKGTSWLPQPTLKKKKPFSDTLRSHQPNLGPTCPFLNKPLARDDSNNGFRPLSMRKESASPLSPKAVGDRIRTDTNKHSCFVSNCS